MRQDISHKKGWENGRPSEPAFMDMNLHATRSDKLPKAVVWQYDTDNPMNPRGLLVAYEEEQILPVVSDFDPFLIGTRGVSFKTLAYCSSQMESPVSGISWSTVSEYVTYLISSRSLGASSCRITSDSSLLPMVACVPRQQLAM